MNGLLGRVGTLEPRQLDSGDARRRQASDSFIHCHSGAPTQASLRNLRKLACKRRARNPVSSAGDYWIPGCLAEPVIGPAEGRTRGLGTRNDNMNCQTSARSRTGPPVAPFTLGRPTTRVAPDAGTLSRPATFSSPQRPDGNQA